MEVKIIQLLLKNIPADIKSRRNISGNKVKYEHGVFSNVHLR